jgi:hypothetical protein
MGCLKLLTADDVKEVVNSFCLDIRHLKTIFSIVNSKAMLDFVLWILSRCDNTMTIICPKINTILEFLYELIRHEVRNKKLLTIVIEESFEEIFMTMKFEHPVDLKPNALRLLNELGDQCVLNENIVCVRLRIREKVKTSPIKPEVSVKEPEIQKEIKILETKEKEMLRQSFVRKTSAIDYVQDIGGDVLDEIRDLESLDEEWNEKLQTLECEPSSENIRSFVEGVLGVYVRAINNLFEFTALAYALSSLGAFLKEHADDIISDPKKLKTLVMLTEHLGSDLTSWREHIFGLQDTADIHYLDSSFFSSCMQIEQIIGNKEVASNDDDDDGMEFF